MDVIHQHNMFTEQDLAQDISLEWVNFVETNCYCRKSHDTA